ncbi:bifunctional dihydrofolate reductase-thymidylate synthase, partial [Cardiosporidium cionae]
FFKFFILAIGYDVYAKKLLTSSFKTLIPTIPCCCFWFTEMAAFNGNLMKRLRPAASAQVPLYIVAAMEPNGGIGKDGKLPWPVLSRDMQHFKHVTTKRKDFDFKNAVVMGRKTWNSLPVKYRPLPERINFVLSKTLLAATSFLHNCVTSLDFYEHCYDIFLYRHFSACSNQRSPIGLFSIGSGKTDSSNMIGGTDVHVIQSVNEMFRIISDNYGDKIEGIFIIGGYQIYKEVMEKGLADSIYLTRIGKKFECDVFMPDIPEDFYEVSSLSSTFVEKDIPFDFVLYSRRNSKENIIDSENECGDDKKICTPRHSINNEIDFIESLTQQNSQNRDLLLSHPSILYRKHEELQYLDCVAEIIQKANKQEDRTGVGTMSLFGKQMRFSLRESFPLLTTKRVFWKGVVEELLWFIKGSTNAKILSEKGVKIWEKNGSRDYLDSIGLTHREAGDLAFSSSLEHSFSCFIGPIYGFQWRHFGADYVDMNTDYTDKGIDQLQDCIHRLKTNPNDRRIILTAWNPSALIHMALPPCHVLCQFYVANGELSCLMFQRSCDMGLGVPFNIASYSLLTCMLAQVCDLKRGDFVYCLGNAHVYLNHIEPLKVQLRRFPRPFPCLKIQPDIKDIDKFQPEHFKLDCYYPYNRIEMDMAV